MKKVKCDLVETALIGLPFEYIIVCNTHRCADIHNQWAIPKGCKLHKATDKTKRGRRKEHVGKGR